MNRNEYQKFHGFSDEDMQRIDDAKLIFNGRVVAVLTDEEYKKMKESIAYNNKLNMNALFIK